ncbi:uncharacterized protein C8R40DRAFT_1169681 [Lentinula edodes]|uniref:uncharacterized protein n=1 Tax=Lentinula edodes TaxID=5353 RepID=UPI001E8D079B|nr:uncharacterized protein C8R40DRAFT_1169681 [Lentinula edodes]KAH7876027.1 hypothetical protein C8R40DRAFT_1169681 [Lentinula edodes]
MVNDSDSRLPETPLSSIPDLSDHNNPATFAGADALLVIVENPVEARSQHKFETRRQHIMNIVTLHRDGIAFKHMDELLAKSKFEDMIDDEAQVVPSPVVKLPWSSPHTSKLLNDPTAET